MPNFNTLHYMEKGSSIFSVTLNENETEHRHLEAKYSSLKAYDVAYSFRMDF